MPIVFENVLMPNASGAPNILTSILPSGVQGTFYTFTMTASGGTLPYVWSLAGGTLDSGVTLSAAGVISGTPVNAETDNITIRVTDAHGLFTTKAFSLTFTPVVNPLTITTTSPLPSGTEFNAYSTTLNATGGSGTGYTWVILTGTLQTGLSLSSAGVISGTATAAGTQTVTIQVTDSASNTTSKSFSLTISPPATLVITTTSPLPSGSNGTPYSTTLNATGGVPGYTWSIISGSLQTGLTLSSTGIISGTPTQTVTDTVTIQVQDSVGTTASKTFSLTISASGGFDFFIAPNGDDTTGDGSLGNPWSLTALNSKQSTYRSKKVGIIGDIAGTQTPLQYGQIGGVQTTIYSYLNTTGNQPFLNIDGGTSGSPTYIGSCNSSGAYVRGWAIIDCANPSGGAHPTKDASQLMGQNGNTSTQVPHPDNLWIDGLTIRNWCYSAIAIESAGANFTNIVIKNCELYGSTTSVTGNNPGAIRFQATTGAEVTNCKIHDCSSASGTFAPAYAAVFSYSSQAVTVTNCTFYNIGASVQQKDTNQDAVISYCYMDFGSFGTTSGNTYGCYYEGITGTGRTTTIHHCIMLGPMMLQGGSPAQFSGDYEFYNNTMYVLNLSNTLFYWQQPLAGGTVHAYNNVFSQQGGSWSGGGNYGTGKYTGANATTIPLWDYNFYLSSPQFCPSGNETVLVSYASWQALGFDTHSHTGTAPYASTPVAQTPSSFALNPSSAANTGSNTGGPCGALDGSGSIGCNF